MFLPRIDLTTLCMNGTIFIEFIKNTPALGPYTLFRYFNMITEKIFGSHTDGADRVRKQQMVQCEWTRLTFEAHRRRKWFAAGLVYWMFNDCRPAANGWHILIITHNPSRLRQVHSNRM